MIVLDASVLIGYLDANDAHHDRAVALLSREIDEDFGVNLLTLAEVLVAPTRLGKRDTVLGIVDGLGVETLPFPAGSAVMLAEIRAETQLRMPDCCLLLSARDRRARVASFDERILKTARLLGMDVADA